MNDLDSTRRLVQVLRDPACYPHAVQGVDVVETHISFVLLTGAFAYKIKKPLRLDFLDFSTLEQRRRFCQEELRLNRRLAPELYLDVVPIGGRPEAPRIGAEPAVEYAVKLREFPAEAVLDRALAANAVSPAQIRGLADLLARFQAAQPASETAAAPGQAAHNLDELETALRKAQRPYALDALRAWTVRRQANLTPLFAARARAGRVREGHGDLHVENLVVLDGRIVPFDALEFSADLRTTDVLDEAGFLVMDLVAHGRRDFAFEFLNRYLEITGDYEGLEVLPFYLVYRALVRAKVRLLKGAETSAGVADFEGRVRPYLLLADELIRPRTPQLTIAHGLSASGKTTITSELIGRLPALRVRSDLERKRLHGVAPDVHEDLAVGEGRYAAEGTYATYEALERSAAAALRAGLDIIVDATFLERIKREDFRALAARLGARFAVLDCEAPEEALRRRVRARAAAQGDASEATEAVLEAQLRTAEALTLEELREAVVVDTTRPIDYDAVAQKLGGL